MNKAQLIQDVSERLEIRRQEAAEVVEAVFEAIAERVAEGERVVISGFGIFEQVLRKARQGRNPRTGEAVAIGAVTLPKFRPGRDFRNLVSGVKEATGLGSKTDDEDQSSTEDLAPSTEEAVSTPPATPAKKTTAKKTTAKKSTAKKTTARKSTAKKTTAKKSTAKKTTAKKTAAKKSTAKKTTQRRTAKKAES